MYSSLLFFLFSGYLLNKKAWPRMKVFLACAKRHFEREGRKRTKKQKESPEIFSRPLRSLTNRKAHEK